MAKPKSTVPMPKKTLNEGDLQIPASMEAKLSVTRGPAKDVVHTLKRSSTTIGRGASADLIIDDEAMSRHHFEVAYRNLEFRIRDLESANGTLLNGSAVEEYALRNGDTISAGDSQLEFTVARKQKKA